MCRRGVTYIPSGMCKTLVKALAGIIHELSSRECAECRQCGLRS